MELGKRIKERREALDLSQEELAKRLGYKSRSSINKIELGSSDIYTSKLITFAEVLQTNPVYLLGLSDNSDPMLKPATIIPFPKNPTHKIPVLGYISAGLPLYAEEHIESYTYTDHNGGAEYFALRVKGDSMNAAQINDGNIIIVRKQDVVENGEIAVVRIGSENATVKRYKQDGNIVQLIPQSFNPAHEIQIYNTKETEINIIGKVVECKIEF